MEPVARAAEVRRLEFHTRKRVEDLFVGHYLSAFKGRGVEFAEVREYQPGDDPRTIDWNVTARTGKPHVKRYIEERELTVMLVVDVSASGDFGSGGLRKRQLIVDVCAALAMAAGLSRDRAGVVLFSDRIEGMIRPGKGSRHIRRVLRGLVETSPKGRGTRIGPALDVVGRLLKRRAMVFVASDFQDDGFGRSLRALAHRHDVIALHVADPRERDLPPAGLVTLEDPETGQTWLVDLGSRAVREAYRRGATDDESAVHRACVQAGVDRVPLWTDQPFIPALLRHFMLRQGRR